MESAIMVSDLSKKFGEREVVQGISFSVRKGEIFGFLGPNGAGKTTSIRMMIGEIDRDGGKIEIMGYPMPEKRDEIKRLIGVVPDHQNLYDRLTVFQNLDFFARLYGVGQARVDELLGMVRLEPHRDVQTVKLSRGLRQRTLIARGLLHDPPVFFLDEPTSALDPHSALAIRNLIQALKNKGTTVFLTTHYMEEANSLCDRLAIMHQGRIVAVDTPEALRMRFGKPSVAVSLKGNGETPASRVELPLQGPETPAKLARMLQEGQVLKIHSLEATLEEAFMQLTGAEWKEQEIP